MKFRVLLPVAAILIAVTVLASPAVAEEVTPGVTFDMYDVVGPNKTYVVAIDRFRPEYKFKVGWPQKKRNFTSRQTVSTIANLYNIPATHKVVAAVNASFFGTAPAITGAAASGGEMLEQLIGKDETFFFGPSRKPAIREDIAHVNGTLTFADGTATTLHSYNKAGVANTATVYTPQWAPTTGTTVEGVEIILAGATYPMRGNKEVAGIVTAVLTGSASVNNAIPAGGMVISAQGTPVSTILAKVTVGDRVRVRFTTAAAEYNNADMAITGIGWLLKNGVANTTNWTQYGYSTERHPRTVLAWNSTQLFMFVCDGRCNGIVGMTFQEMSDFLINTLGATDAINLDGGGSTTMWVDGMVRNLPSDSCGTERAVANAVLLVQEDTSTVFPISDSFGSAGRSAGWEDKFTDNPVKAFSPVSPGGDGYVLIVDDPAGGVDTVRRGDYGDTDYTVQADMYCEYRPGVASNGYERYALFARDNGTGALGLTGSYGPGNCYALTYDSDTGRVRAGKYVNGVLTDFRESDKLYMASTAWRNFRIECLGSTIRYLVDNAAIATVTDSTHASGYFGIGFHEFFTTNSNIHGTRADNFLAITSRVPVISSLAINNGASTATGRTVILNNVCTDNPTEYMAGESPDFAGAAWQAYTTDPSFILSAGDGTKTVYLKSRNEAGESNTVSDTIALVECHTPRMDSNGDLHVDATDFDAFSACYNGPTNRIGTGCVCIDANGDQYVDAIDFDAFSACYNGPTNPPGCN